MIGWLQRRFHRHRWQEEGEFWLPCGSMEVLSGQMNYFAKGQSIRSCRCDQVQHRDPRRVEAWVRKDRWQNTPYLLADLERVMPRGEAGNDGKLPVVMPGEGGTFDMELKQTEEVAPD